MQSITVAINDLFEFEGQAIPASKPENAMLEVMVRRQFSFLPQPLEIQIGVESVTVSFADEAPAAQQEAVRLAGRAGKRAAEGNHQKAIGILKRALGLQPTLHSARRDLAMAYAASGDFDNAKNHLIEILRLNAKDHWSWVTLANLYSKNFDDLDTAEKFLRRALALSPDDPWALNSLGAVLLERGLPEDAARVFQRAISANPEVANPHYGLALTYCKTNKLELASETLRNFFAQGKMQDSRSIQVFENARALLVDVQTGLAEQHHAAANEAVEKLRVEMEQLSGYPVRVSYEDFQAEIGALIQMAWKHSRDHHLIRCRKSYPKRLMPHMLAHELGHLRLESNARRSGKNRFFVSSAKARETMIRRMEDDILRWQKRGHSESSITNVVLDLIQRACAHLLNCPIDMIIETSMRDSMPLLSPAQFLSLRLLALEAWEADSNAANRELTPRLILRPTLALNGAYALFLDDLFRGATSYASNYRKEETFAMSERLFRHWQTRFPKLGHGDEYAVVDEFASMLGLKDWYEWKSDPGA
jgi:Tfp pilus assembly protein PilF